MRLFFCGGDIGVANYIIRVRPSTHKKQIRCRFDTLFVLCSYLLVTLPFLSMRSLIGCLPTSGNDLVKKLRTSSAVIVFASVTGSDFTKALSSPVPPG